MDRSGPSASHSAGCSPWDCRDDFRGNRGKIWCCARANEKKILNLGEKNQLKDLFRTVMVAKDIKEVEKAILMGEE